METPAQGASGYYVWDASGKSFEVRVNLGLIDTLAAEVMRGFGAVPKRGAEVGGLLLGTIERGSPTIIHVEDFEPVPCGYTRGPSFLLSPEEREEFEKTAEAWVPDPSRPYQAVGMYRSHTRDGLALAPEDIELMDHCFADPAHVALLVKPFATRASQGGFFFREDGKFQEATPLEFPFRRRELVGEEPPEHRPLTDRRPRNGADGPTRDDQPEFAMAAPSFGQRFEPPKRSYDMNPPPGKMTGWMWLPLSFIFLLLGVALGYMAALSIGPKTRVTGTPDYSLALSVQKFEGSLSVQWNGESALIREADRGVLEIHDGEYSKSVDLDAAQLRTGKVAFHNASDVVSFHLTVYLNSRLTVSETLDWHQ